MTKTSSEKARPSSTRYLNTLRWHRQCFSVGGWSFSPGRVYLCLSVLRTPSGIPEALRTTSGIPEALRKIRGCQKPPGSPIDPLYLQIRATGNTPRLCQLLSQVQLLPEPPARLHHPTGTSSVRKPREMTSAGLVTTGIEQYDASYC